MLAGVVLSVAPVWLDVVALVEACGVFLVSSVCVEPDVLLVELCANMVTEKLNAAAIVSSFFMCISSPGGKTEFAYSHEDACCWTRGGLQPEVSC